MLLTLTSNQQLGTTPGYLRVTILPPSGTFVGWTCR